MAMKVLYVTIKGISPLLMHRYPMEPIEAFEKKSPEEQAELVAYRIPESRELYIPGVAVQRALIGAAVFIFSKGKGRASLQKPVAACFMIAPGYLGLGTTEYTIDTRAVVIPSTRGHVLRHNPRLDKWGVSFELTFDDVLVTEAQARKIVDDGGSRMGLLYFRPAHKGPFGRFIVTRWETNK